MGRHRLAVVAAVIAWFGAIALAEPNHKLASVLIEEMPHVKQRPDFCGEACVEMAARRLGKTYDQNDVFAATELDPALGRGAYTPELVHAVEKLGFKPGHVYTLVDEHSPRAAIERELAALHADLVRGVPSIVCMHYDDQPHTTEHFRLVIGYDADRDELVYQEPAVEDGSYRRMSRAMFEQLWQLPSSTAGKRVLVRIPLNPGTLAEPAHTTAAADNVQHVMELREKLDGAKLGHLAIRVVEPFVVIGDRQAVAHATKATIERWATAGDVFLFRDAKATAHARDALGDIGVFVDLSR